MNLLPFSTASLPFVAVPESVVQAAPPVQVVEPVWLAVQQVEKRLAVVQWCRLDNGNIMSSTYLAPA